MIEGVFKNQGENMGCERVKKDLFSYIDGDLSPSQEISVNEHLNECASCSRNYRLLLDSWNSLDEWEDTMPAADLRDRILEGIKPKKTANLRIFVPIAAGLLIIIAAAFFFKIDTPTHRELTASNRSAINRSQKEIPGELEKDIISNLHLLTEKEFYDSFERLENLDYLPLVEDQVGPGEDQKSSLEYHSA
jgi:hypothetical protein